MSGPVRRVGQGSRVDAHRRQNVRSRKPYDALPAAFVRYKQFGVDRRLDRSFEADTLSIVELLGVLIGVSLHQYVRRMPRSCGDSITLRSFAPLP